MAFIFDRKYFLFFMMLVLSIFFVKAQNDSSHFRKNIFCEKGFIIGYGYGLSNTDIPEGNYRPVFIMAHFGLNPFKKIQREMPGLITVFFEPQINPVFVNSDLNNLEFGLNVGVQHLFMLTKKFGVFENISAGPHFIGVHTSWQARGFIFSDNMGAGVYFFMSPKMLLNAGFRIRHISNADTRFPNHGINTYNFYFGVSKIIW